MSLELEVEFCFKLLPLLDAASNSTVFSPVSILNTLAIIFSGSDGSTAKQISTLIGKGKTEKEIIKYYSEFVKGLKEDNDKESPLKTDKKSDNEDLSEDPEEISPKRRRFYDPLNDPNAKVICNIVNAIFVGNNVSIVPSYKTLIKDIFNAQIQSIDFEKSENAATKINAFVSEKTNSNIKEIISAEDLSSSDGKTSLILINAIHFVGTWNLMFDEDRKDEIFNSLPSSRILSMMSNTISASQEGWNYQEEEKEGNWQALGIPYKNCKHSLFIILPKEKDGLLNLIKNFNFSFFKQCTKRQKLPRTTHVLMPIMEIEETIDLKEKLMNFGVTDLFSSECDLSKMLQEQNKIEKAFHKAIIKIDEKGTVASAGTTFRAIARSSGVITFNATHPFLYFIISNDGTKLMKPKDILFMGTFC